jgi:hypothetical protein
MKVPKSTIKKVKSLWKSGKNAWEISQITGLPESVILDIVNSNN